MSTAEGHPNILVIEEPMNGFRVEPEHTIAFSDWTNHDVVLVRSRQGLYRCIKHRSANKDQVQVDRHREPEPHELPRRWGLGKVIKRTPQLPPVPMLGASD